MTTEYTDGLDPVTAFAEYRCRPKGVVEREPRAEDAAPIPTGIGVSVHSDEVGADGVTRETEGWSITGPSFYSVEDVLEHKRQREGREHD